jgi:hypothetical protein
MAKKTDDHVLFAELAKTICEYLYPLAIATTSTDVQMSADRLLRLAGPSHDVNRLMNNSNIDDFSRVLRGSHLAEKEDSIKPASIHAKAREAIVELAVRLKLERVGILIEAKKEPVSTITRGTSESRLDPNQRQK